MCRCRRFRGILPRAQTGSLLPDATSFSTATACWKKRAPWPGARRRSRARRWNERRPLSPCATGTNRRRKPRCAPISLPALQGWRERRSERMSGAPAATRPADAAPMDPLWDAAAMPRKGGEALVVDVDGFEGPLDLLLHLARAQKVDLARIS